MTYLVCIILANICPSGCFHRLKTLMLLSLACPVPCTKKDQEYGTLLFLWGISVLLFVCFVVVFASRFIKNV